MGGWNPSVWIADDTKQLWQTGLGVPAGLRTIRSQERYHEENQIRHTLIKLDTHTPEPFKKREGTSSLKQARS